MRRHFYLLFLYVLSGSQFAAAHPMDLSRLEIAVKEDRLVINLQLHRLVAEELVPSAEASSPETLARRLFERTLRPSNLKLNGLPCDFLKPAPGVSPMGGDYVAVTVVASCHWNQKDEPYLYWTLPFVEGRKPAFQLLATLLEPGRGVTAVADPRHPVLEMGEDSRTFLGFVKMGMGHIGARWEEWRTARGGFQWPDGIDHIFFVIALTLAGGTLWNLFKTATGFTVGHSLTLALSTYRVIHIHSKWIEVGIAFSVAYVAGRILFRKGSRAENWIAAALFGAVHGLGFSAALQDLELSRSEVLPALAGFNLGVEAGQCLFILLILALLYGIRRVSTEAEKRVRQALGWVVFLTGLYWMYYRAFV